MEPLITASMNQATPDRAFFISTSMGRGEARSVHTSMARSRTRHRHVTGIVLVLVPSVKEAQISRRDQNERRNERNEDKSLRSIKADIQERCRPQVDDQEHHDVQYCLRSKAQEAEFPELRGDDEILLALRVL